MDSKIIIEIEMSMIFMIIYIIYIIVFFDTILIVDFLDVMVYLVIFNLFDIFNVAENINNRIDIDYTFFKFNFKATLFKKNNNIEL